jgi:hypothetical protein
MTCFWDGLISALGDKQISEILNVKIKKKSIKPIKFVEKLKENNKMTENVTWNEQKLTEQEMKENYERVKELDTDIINKGYLCAASDPFLFLVCELFEINIIFNMNGTVFKYINKKVNNPDYAIKLESNKRHLYLPN